MPPVSQFPPARVFLKTPSSLSSKSVPTAARHASMTANSYQSPHPRSTTTSSTTSPSRSQTATPQSSGTAASSASRGYGAYTLSSPPYAAIGSDRRGTDSALPPRSCRASIRENAKRTFYMTFADTRSDAAPTA
ncbi:hypothetical protein EJ04DRAFT_522613 [Polyplosphaeria fusca]|uniref:Uncharacterized protein n=1 Tax=Polyplosphaeria fusca TaxID=682080 RepID=A0A9P4R2W8_9PLEO|nr:hypothetical protein EJ04DRAFT_522613 [Polyplosphaeria fusca]